MAPGAKWIGCRNMDENVGTPARYIECMEFFLAPYPVNGDPGDGDPSLAPDITINSWGLPDFGRLFGQHIASRRRSSKGRWHHDGGCSG